MSAAHGKGKGRGYSTQHEGRTRSSPSRDLSPAPRYDSEGGPASSPDPEPFSQFASPASARERDGRKRTNHKSSILGAADMIQRPSDGTPVNAANLADITLRPQTSAHTSVPTWDSRGWATITQQIPLTGRERLPDHKKLADLGTNDRTAGHRKPYARPLPAFGTDPQVTDASDDADRCE